MSAPPSPRRCWSCDRPLVRQAEETTWTFAHRRGCTPKGACTGRGAIPPDYPGAIPAAHVPARCPRCEGPWRIVDDGVLCRLCGHGPTVQEALQALVARGQVRAHTEMPMPVRLTVGGAKRRAG